MSSAPRSPMGEFYQIADLDKNSPWCKIPGSSTTSARMCRVRELAGLKAHHFRSYEALAKDVKSMGYEIAGIA